MTDWEKRAYELLPDERPDSFVLIYAPQKAREAALQLGREMADARAEEIAFRISVEATTPGEAATIARSFISKKPDDPLVAMPLQTCMEPHPTEEWIRKDEREKCAEEIAKAIEDHHGDTERGQSCASIARSFIQKPKAREQVLEEALREIITESAAIVEKLPYGGIFLHNSPRNIASRALRWKP